MQSRFTWLVLIVFLAAPLALAGNGPMGPGGGGGPFGNGQNGIGQHGGPSADRARVARSLLTVSDTSPDEDVCGRVDLLSVPNADRERFRIVVCRLDAEATVSVTLDDGAGLTYDLGEIVADERGHAVLDLDTQAGDDLPGAASSLADLEGLAVTVRDADDAVLLQGTVPSFDDALERPWMARLQAGMCDGDGPEAKVKLKLRDRARHRLKLKVKNLEANETCELWVEDAETGGLRFALRLRADGRGRMKLKLRAEGDQDLVPGCGGADDLGGLAFQIRNRAGDAVLCGLFPTAE